MNFKKTLLGCMFLAAAGVTGDREALIDRLACETGSLSANDLSGPGLFHLCQPRLEARASSLVEQKAAAYA